LRSLPYLAWLTVCLVWGTTYLGIAVALESIPPALVGGIRWTIAGAILAAGLRARGTALPSRDKWLGFATASLLMIGLGNGAVVFAEQWVPSGIAAVIIASSPFWLMGIEALLPDGERLTRQGLAGLLIGFSGIVLLVWPDLTVGGEGGRQFALGVVLLQVACLGWTAGTSYARRFAREDNALAGSALQMIFAGVAMLALATVRGEWADLTFTTRSLVAEIYLTLVGSLLAYSAYLYAIRHLPLSTVSLYSYINPVIAVVLGSLLLAEPFGMRIVIASALVLAGVAAVKWKGAKKAAGRAPAGARQPKDDQDNRNGFEHRPNLLSRRAAT
jgi:drug/metabolite transporter (DMT)-like permease